MDTPVTVYLRGGVYELSAKLSFGPEDTGTEAAPITYASFPGERAVISGGRRITGQWWKSPGRDTYELLIPEVRDGAWRFNSLSVNGMSRPRARKPNWDQKVLRAKGRAPGHDERQAFAYCHGDIDPGWTNLTDIDLVLLCSWTPTVHRIEEVLPAARVVKFTSSHTRAVDFWERNFRYYVANVFEELDAPGEWYLNRATGVLYYLPMPGEDMATADVVAPVLKSRLVEFRGDIANARFIEHIRFVDLDFRHVDGDLDRYNGVYRQGHMFLDAAIYAEGLRHAVFRNCELAQFGEYAVELGAGCQHNRIEHCHIWDIGAGAIQLGASDLRRLQTGGLGITGRDLVLEAERAALVSPFVVRQDESASGGAYAVLPADQTGGSLTFDVVIEKAGPYGFMARVRAPDGGADSFTVQIDDGAVYTYDTGTGSRWFFSPVVARELAGKPVVLELEAGDHTVTIGGREAETKIDQLVLRPHDGSAGEHRRRDTEALANTIDNNCIHRLGTVWHGCYGVVNRFASRTLITHNDIFDVHWDAIGLDARWSYKGEKYSHGNVVAYNHLHHLGLGYHTDAAGVYQFGPLDTHIHHNHVHDTVAYPYICGYAGIYLDQQSRGALIENNLVYNADWLAYFQHKGVDNIFRNNIGAFARDGLIQRGGLNEAWKANHLEAYRNVYIARDNIALRRGWQPGERPPVLHHNMYFSTAAGTDLTFAGKSFSEWQADGQDAGSILGDPGCTDPAKFDFTLKPDAPAVRAIGFVPFDRELRKAGLYGEPEWRSLPKRCPRREPAPTWTADDLARLIAFDMDFEDMPVGHEPSVFRLAKGGAATFAVTDEAACTGTKSYRCIDRPGLKKPFYPYIHIAPRKIDRGRVRFSFDVMNSATAPAHFYVECRGKRATNDVGPSIHFSPDGVILANDRQVGKPANGTWCHVDITFSLGPEAPGSYELTTAVEGTEHTERIPFKHDSFTELRWLGFSASNDAHGVFYLDNMVLGFE